MVEINWLIEARNDLKEIFNFISNDSRRYAKRQVDNIINKTEILKTQSKIGKVVDEINRPEIRELIEGNYRIIYRVIS